MQTFYFLKGEAKIEAPGRESWLNEDGFFVKADINGQSYLVQYEAEEREMTTEAMQTNYAMSKTSDIYDCELGVVTEAIVTPPTDLEIITPDQMAEMLLGAMGQMYS